MILLEKLINNNYIDSLVKKYYNILVNKKKNITHFKKFDYDVFIVLDKKSENDSNIFFDNKEKHIIITIFAKNNDIKNALRHELIHMLDFFKSIKKNNLVLVRKTKDSYETSYVTYFKDPIELNAFIHIIKNLDTGRFNKLKSYEDLFRFYFKYHDNYEISDDDNWWFKNLIKDKNLKRKILSRLSRERIIPKSFFN